MHLALFVVCHRILLQTAHHQVVSYLDGLAGLRLHHYLQYVEQFACIASAISHYGASLFQLDVELLQLGVSGYGTLQEFHQVVFLQWLQHIELTTGQERTDNLKRGILSGSTNEGDDASLHSPQQRILLRLGETVYLVNEENGGSGREESVVLGSLYDIANILYATGNSREGVERSVELVGYNLCQCSLAHSWRSPQNERVYMPRINHSAQYGSFAHQVFLSYVLIERLRPKALC